MMENVANPKANFWDLVDEIDLDNLSVPHDGIPDEFSLNMNMFAPSDEEPIADDPLVVSQTEEEEVASLIDLTVSDDEEDEEDEDSVVFLGTNKDDVPSPKRPRR